MDSRKIFLSYSAGDRAFADKLREALTAGHHAQVWDPVAAIEPGTSIEDAVQEELSNSDLLVYIIPASEGSGKWSLAELGAAKALGKKIVAVLPDSGRVANSSVAAKLADFLVVDEDRKSPEDIANEIFEVKG